MRLNRSTDYAIRVVLCLAKEERAISSSKLSKMVGVSSRYLLQIGARLRGAGLIETVYGPNGGLVLLKPTEEISLYDIIMVMEGDAAPFESYYGAVKPFEALHIAYGNVEEMWVRSLKDVTIASLLL